MKKEIRKLKKYMKKKNETKIGKSEKKDKNSDKFSPSTPENVNSF